MFFMANLEQLKTLRQGVEAWNSWRVANPGTSVDLSNADLTLGKLRGANLSGANLMQARLYGADLRNANCLGGGFYGTDLTGAEVVGANFTAASFGDTVLANIEFKDVTGLESVYHALPSTIDHRTLGKSGPLPLSFLRGCGLPDKFIDYIPSLFINQPVELFSCFISYSAKDKAFAERLHADLQNEGVRCWFAPHDLQGGRKIHEQIDEAILVYDRLLLIISEASMHSEWVQTEIAKARKREMREDRRMLFPVRLVDFNTLLKWECFDADYRESQIPR